MIYFLSPFLVYVAVKNISRGISGLILFQQGLLQAIYSPAYVIGFEILPTILAILAAFDMLSRFSKLKQPILLSNRSRYKYYFLIILFAIILGVHDFYKLYW